MWQYSKGRALGTLSARIILFLGILFFCATHLYSAKSDLVYNPAYQDSILKNKSDSALWTTLHNKATAYHAMPGYVSIQQQRQNFKSQAFLMVFVFIVLLLLVFRMLFEDYMFSLLEGLGSIKKFFIFYKTKKYDSFLAIVFIYTLKVFMSSLIFYGVVQYVFKEDFNVFNMHFYLNSCLVFGSFFLVKDILEYIFNVITNTQETFKAFFLQNMFAELLLSILLLFLLIIFVYNDHISNSVVVFLMVIGFVWYFLFNVIRSYQLIDNVRILHKLHFFLYICAFKILPILLLGKYIFKNMVE